MTDHLPEISGTSILVVDDSLADLNLLSEILAEQGYEVQLAVNGPNALAIAQARSPDLIMLDVLVPPIDGYQICQQLKDDQRTRDIPVIFISALNEPTNKVKAFSVGGVDYISKPFQIQELLARVRTHLKLYRLQQELETKHERLQQEIDERKQTEKSLERNNRALQVLHKVALDIQSELDMSVLLCRIMKRAVDLLGADRGGGIYLYEAQEKGLRLVEGSGINADRTGTVLQLDEGMAGRVFQTAQPVTISDYTHWKGRSTVLVDWPASAVMGVPLLSQGEVIGILGLFADSQGRIFDQQDVHLAEMFADQAVRAIENARLYQQIRRDAETKTMLLQEVNHRVKNNLMGIVGMLYITRRYARQSRPDSPSLEIIEDLIYRIDGLVAVHRMLAEAEWSHLSLDKLAVEIINTVLQSLPLSNKVSIDLTAPDLIMVTAKQASNLAMITNELATNVIKYSLADRPTVQISLSVTQDKDTVTFEFRDNGPGYPAEVLALKHHGVGLYLIQNLVEVGLNGQLALHNQQGAVTTIRFPAVG